MMTFDKAIEIYLSNIESLRTTLPLLLNQLENLSEKAANDHDQFLADKCEYREEEKNYFIGPENIKEFKIRKLEASNFNLSTKITSRSFLISLVSQFDTYVGNLIKCIFEVQPHLIDGSDKRLSYSQLKEFDSLDSARNFIIEKEIESVLRESHSEQFRWFENKLGVNLRKDLPAWLPFIEITQRRNLFVHNDGKVSSQYLNVCKENRIEHDNKLGDSLECDTLYFEKAYRYLFEIGVKLNQVIRRKISPKILDAADKSFVNITFDLVDNEQYILAKELFDFAFKYIKKISNRDVELRNILNRAQTYKWLGDNAKCLSILNEHDWSTLDVKYKLAANVLLDKYNDACIDMNTIGNNDSAFNRAFYRDWPIFKEFRKSEEFTTTYRYIYKEDLTIIESV